MINRKLKLINFVITFSLVFFGFTFSSYNNSYADHCAYPYTHDSNGDCSCSDDISDCSDPCGDGRLSSCDICSNGANNPPDCSTCNAGEEMYNGSCVSVCTPPDTRDSGGACSCSDDMSDCSDPCGDGRLSSCDICSNGANNPPDCTECPADQHMENGECVYDECIPPDEGTYPDCGTCTVSGTSGYPTCNCTSTGNPPTGTPLTCTVDTPCCNDDTALNYDSSCPDVPNHKVVDNSTCTRCTPSSTDAKCKVTYCPDTDPGGNSCKTANPDKNCTSDESACTYYYCNKSTGRPDNYDPGGNDCVAAHPSPRVCTGDEFVCTYADVPYCDQYDNPDATNGQTKQDCEEWNDPHLCVSDDSVCSNPCTGNDCVEIGYCFDPLCSNYDAGGANCNATKPADATCVASLASCTSCTPYLYCGIPGFTNYSDGAGCADNHAECASDISACLGTATCNIGFDVDVTCASGFTFTGTFAYAYQYDNTGQCVPPNADELNDIANYLEGRVCTDVPPATPPANIDWCPSTAGVQTSPDDCPTDICPDMDGIQTTESECQDTDVCPEGYYYKEDDGCTPIDICPNIDGNQAVMPTNYTFNSVGNCTNGGGQSSDASCSNLAGSYQSTDNGITASSACNVGIFGNYVAFDVSTNPDSYNWNCYGVRGGAVASCRAYKGTSPACGVSINNIYELDTSLASIPTTDLCSFGTVSNLSKSEPITLEPITVPPQGEGTIDWKCNYGAASTTCSAESTGCLVGDYCPQTKTCEETCPPFTVDLGAALKTTKIVNKGEYCTVYLKDSISSGTKDTLCYLENLTKGTKGNNFQPYNGGSGQWSNGVAETFSEVVGNDTLYKLTCWEDSEDPGNGNVGNGSPDANELIDTVQGTCRLNLNSKEFN
jgi:hypothetical protein